MTKEVKEYYRLVYVRALRKNNLSENQISTELETFDKRFFDKNQVRYITTLYNKGKDSEEIQETQVETVSIALKNLPIIKENLDKARKDAQEEFRKFNESGAQVEDNKELIETLRHT